MLVLSYKVNQKAFALEYIIQNPITFQKYSFRDTSVLHPLKPKGDRMHSRLIQKATSCTTMTNHI